VGLYLIFYIFVYICGFGKTFKKCGVICVSLRVMGNTGVPKAPWVVGYGWVRPARTLLLVMGWGISKVSDRQFGVFDLFNALTRRDYV